MKKFLLVLLFAVASTAVASAQFINPEIPDGALKRKGGLMKAVDKTNKVKLTPEQVAYVLSNIDGVDYNDEWNELNRNRKKGAGLIAGGTIAAGVGAGVFCMAGIVHILVFIIGAPVASLDDSGESMETFQKNLEKEFAPWYIGSGIVVGAGTACVIAGIPTTVKNGKKMNAIVNRYNETLTPAASQPAVTLTFGPTRSGIGFALNF